MNILDKKLYTRAFTLVEMIVAVAIFSVSMAALTLIAGKGIISSGEAQDRLTAEFLAIEGIEVVRNIRDSKFLDGINNETTWQDIFDLTEIDQDSDYTFNSNRNSLEICTTCRLADNSYDYDANATVADTRFSRKIRLTEGSEGSEGELVVTVTVEWPGNNKVELKTTMFLWYK